MLQAHPIVKMRGGSHGITLGMLIHVVSSVVVLILKDRLLLLLRWPVVFRLRRWHGFVRASRFARCHRWRLYRFVITRSAVERRGSKNKTPSLAYFGSSWEIFASVSFAR